MGVILAVAVLLDATLIRLLLQPVVLRLLGARAWWMPALARPPGPERRAGPARAGAGPSPSARRSGARAGSVARKHGVPAARPDGGARRRHGGRARRAQAAGAAGAAARVAQPHGRGRPARRRPVGRRRSGLGGEDGADLRLAAAQGPAGRRARDAGRPATSSRSTRRRSTSSASTGCAARAARRSRRATRPSAAAQLREALGLWRGEALAEFDEPFAQVERTPSRGAAPGLPRGPHRRRPAAGPPRGAGRRARGRGRPATRCASGCAGSRCSRSTAPAGTPTRSRSTRTSAAGSDDELGLEPSLELRDAAEPDPQPGPVARARRGARRRGRAARRRPRPGEALGRGAWEEAKAAFERVLADGEPPRRWRAGRRRRASSATATRAWSARARAFRAYRERGDARSAARAAAWLAYDTVVFRGDDAVAQGWFGHAHRLLGGRRARARSTAGSRSSRARSRSIAHGDAGARGRARGAGAGRSAGAPASMDLEMLALSLTGLARVAAGEIAEGMRELDQATAAAVAGELSGLHFAGAVCCHMIYACERVHDVERAAQWCDTVRGFTEEWSVPQLFGFCRSHYASVLIWRGRVERRRDRAHGSLAGLRARCARAGLRGHPAPGGAAPPAGPPRRRRRSSASASRGTPRHSSASPRSPWTAAMPPAARDLVARHLRALPAGERLGRASGLELGVRVDLALQDVRAAEAGVDGARRSSPRPPGRRRCAPPRGSRAASWPARAATRPRPGETSRTRSTSGAACERPTSSPADASRSPSWRRGRREPTPTERGGFEPPDEFPRHTISSRARSAAPAPLLVNRATG